MQKMPTYNRGESKNIASTSTKVFPVIGGEYPREVIPFLETAKHKIKIIVFDWRWYPNTPGSIVQKFTRSIFNASKRGVKVQVIGNHDDVLSVLRRFNCEAKKLVTQKLVHTKLIIIDDNITVIGSHNFTHNAFTKNYEASVIIENEEVAKSFDLYFKLLWSL